jgi:hypothetical protein
MIPIDPRQLGELEWSQPSAFSRQYELRSGDSLLATLKFVTAFGSLARAETAACAWTFKRSGFFSPRVTARVEGSQTDVALYEPNWSGSKGSFLFPGSCRLLLRAANFWASEWIVSSEPGETLLRFHQSGVFHHGAKVDVEPPARSFEHLALLLTLSWYVLTLHQQDHAAAGAAIGG